MKKARLLIAIVLVVAVLLTFFGCESGSSLISEDGNYKYELVTADNVQTAKLLQYLGTDSEVIIPQEIDNYQVTELGDGLFVNTIKKEESRKKAGVYTANTTIKKVTVQDNIKELPPRMFYNCTQLTEVILPDTLEVVGAFAFFGCSKLEDITLPISVKDIQGYAFRQCTSLKNVNIYSEELPKIGEKVFYCIDSNKKGKDQYTIINGLNINVKNIELFQLKTIDDYYKQTKSMDYSYWGDYIKASILKEIED